MIPRTSSVSAPSVSSRPTNRRSGRSTSQANAHGERSLSDELKDAAPPDVAYHIAAALSVDATERQALLELATAADRLGEETRILRRETELLRDLLVRLRARGERDARALN